MAGFVRETVAGTAYGPGARSVWATAGDPWFSEGVREITKPADGIYGSRVVVSISLSRRETGGKAN